MLKILLVGPFPPPHGGVSVHVLTLQELLRKAEIPCHVLNISRDAPESDRYDAVRGPLHFVLQLSRYSLKGWSLHVHINGHNTKSWLVAFAAGLAGMAGPGAMLTIHSGMAPAYLREQRTARTLARVVSRLYRHIIAVNSEIKDVLCSLSVPEERIEIMPAFLQAPAIPLKLPSEIGSWLETHHPVISTALFFRPEYGFELLVHAISELRNKYSGLGCIVMGDSESRSRGESLIREHGLQQHMLAVGDVTHDLCLAIMARSEMFVRSTFSDGDAISVREAIALGTPVVASDVVRRPAGTICFKTGDPADLAVKIDSLMSSAGPWPCTASDSGSNGIHRLLELYSS